MKLLNKRGAVDIIFIAVLVLVAAVGYYVITQASNADEEVQDSNINTSNVVNQETINKANDNTDGSEANELALPVETIDLAAVGDYEGSGSATRTTEGEFVHEVSASLGDPAEGKFYEGWLVGPSVVSTGKLVKEAEGQWSLTFTSTDDLSQHNRVVITEETEADGLDGKPEAHVLEGSF